MAMNFAEKYASQIDERFKLEALSTPVVNSDYDFVGVKTVKVYSVPTAPLNDYTRSGMSRYGSPEELENSVQELTMSRDRAFTFTIDRGNLDDTMMVNTAGLALQRQIDEVITPEVDIYRFGVICAKAGTVSEAVPITEKNAYASFLDATMALTDKKCPVGGRIAYVSPAYYKCIKMDDAFIKASEISQEMILKGQVGQIDGVPVITVPTSYLPDGVEFFVSNPIATVAPMKLSDYKIHDNPPGVNGWLVEGRVYYDAFVLDNKADAIYVHRSKNSGE